MIDTVLSLTTPEHRQPSNTVTTSSDATLYRHGSDELASSRGPGTQKPTLFHKVKNQKSILAIAVSDSKIYSGTQDGELKVHGGSWHGCCTAYPRVFRFGLWILTNCSQQFPRTEVVASFVFFSQETSRYSFLAEEMP